MTGTGPSRARSCRGGSRFPVGGRAEAFTIIELLVVIAILVLLIAILLPTLDRAKYLALRTACAAGEHHIGGGLITWAQEHDKRLPHTGEFWNWPSMTYVMYQNGAGRLWGAPDHVDEPVNLGLLLADEVIGTLRNDRIVICPTYNYTEACELRSQTDGPGPWGAYDSPRLGHKVRLRTRYNKAEFPDDGQHGPYSGRPLWALSSDWPVYADVFSSGRHVLESHGDGVNVLWADQSVSYVTDRNIPDLTDPDRKSYGGSAEMRDLWDRIEANR
ncbi:MAG: hypothetical protein ACOC8F_03860 [Planctomycetota bacterium]